MIVVCPIIVLRAGAMQSIRIARPTPPGPASYLAAIAQMKSIQAAVDEIVRTWFHQVQSLR